MAMARMEDIGGARVVVSDIRDIERLWAHVKRRSWDITRVRDYIVEPAPSGYRAVHLVVRKQNRKLEIQLRTRTMHDWADTVEGMGRRLGMELKSGEGPRNILDLLSAIADINHAVSLGLDPPPEAQAEYDRLLSELQAKGSANG